MMTTHRDLVLVDVEDEFGKSEGRAVPVVVEYARERFPYGSDADGSRAVMMESLTILDASMAHEVMYSLRIWQIGDCLERAKRQVERQVEG